MNFEKQYLTATRAFDTKAFVEATEVYVDLLKTDKDQVMTMICEYESARLVHYAFAMQYALQKILIQRIQNKERLSITLASSPRPCLFS